MLNEEIIENTENFKRNPFERIGKVFKYEFIHASKTLIPLYAVLLLLGLLHVLVGFIGVNPKWPG